MIDIILNQKPAFISIRYNGYYKLVLLLAIIKYCAYRRKASLVLIHVVFWGLRNNDNYDVLYDFSKQIRKTLRPWTFEHGLDKVLALGYISQYIERVIVGEELEIRLTEEGDNIINSINDFQLFQDEIDKIKKLGKISKQRLFTANKNWSLT